MALICELLPKSMPKCIKTLKKEEKNELKWDTGRSHKIYKLRYEIPNQHFLFKCFMIMF